MSNKSLINFGDLSLRMRQWRRQIHQYPETGYQEFQTAALIASVLEEFGIEYHDKIATTGIVAVIKKGESERSIGLRADMDALDLEEANTFEHRSKHPGKMHACGHDGHTAMLLGAACYLAKEMDFDGTVYLIFQPAEEMEGGAKQMIEEGLFDRFPMDAVFGMHNWPQQEKAKFAICPGPMMAAFGAFECQIKGKGMHSSMPHLAIDPIEIGTEIHRQWKAICYNDIEPLQPSVISVTQFHSGTAQNVSPETAVLRGSTRCFSDEVAQTIERRLAEIAEAICGQYGATCEFHYKQAYPVLINEPASTLFAAKVAAECSGVEQINSHIKPVLASEDFACMLQQRPGAYIFIGNGVGEDGGCMVHNPNYDFNDDIIETGASYWVKLARAFLAEPPA